ncbi:MAG: molecular chaperone DnaJ [Rhodothalassiaceae bacterium]
MSRCYYEILGVERTADPGTIKKAYRRLAMECHPDRNGGDPEAERRFKEITEAYDILKDEQKRAAYDRYGHAAFSNGHARGPHGFSAESFSDIFDQFFGDMMGGARGRSSVRRGADLRYDLEIDLEEAYRGSEEAITIPCRVACEECGGTGAAEGSEPEICPACRGAGKIRATQGFFTIERPCTGCRGAGRIVTRPCRSCHGMGQVETQRTLAVRVPPGVENGTRIRLAGEGEPGLRGGPAGDLYIFVSIRPHALFEREGSDIYCRVPLPMTTAILGGEIDVPTIAGGRSRVRIPEGTQTGRRFRLRGKGMPVLGSAAHGDMIIETVIETPVNLTREQKERIRALAAELGEDTAPQSKSFFAKVRDLWEDLTD